MNLQSRRAIERGGLEPVDRDGREAALQSVAIDQSDRVANLRRVAGSEFHMQRAADNRRLPADCKPSLIARTAIDLERAGRQLRVFAANLRARRCVHGHGAAAYIHVARAECVRRTGHEHTALYLSSTAIRIRARERERTRAVEGQLAGA